MDRLLTWYREGRDVNALLPVLATYMGHVDIRSTRVYLRPTAELLAAVNTRFRVSVRRTTGLDFRAAGRSVRRSSLPA